MLSDNHSNNKSTFFSNARFIDKIQRNGSIAQNLSIIPPIKEKPPLRNFSNNLPCKSKSSNYDY